MPLFLPPAVLGVALLAFFGSFSLHQTYLSITVVHSPRATPIAFLILQSVLTQVDWNRRDAALDLGASPTRTFAEVVLLQIKEGLVASILIAFIISIQEFVMTLFLAGEGAQTIPVLAWRSISQVLDPVVNVVSTLLIVVVTVILLIAASLIGLD
jgi:ABC-type spermidine/putrescine transport system permease subunit II